MSDSDFSGADTPAQTPEISSDASSFDTSNNWTVSEDDFDAANASEDSGETEEAAPDVSVVTDPPASRQSEEVKDDKPEKELAEAKTPVKTEEPAKAEVAESEAAEKTEKPQDKSDTKLNWDDDKIPFRKEHRELNAKYLDLLYSSPENQFISNPSDFKEWLNKKSPTAYDELGTLLATESAEKNPKGWLEYLSKAQPDLLAQYASGIFENDEDGKPLMTAERLKAKAEMYYDSDYVDDAIARRRQEAKDEKPPETVETPEQKEVREWREEREFSNILAIQSAVFQPIEQEIDSSVSAAGLEIKESDYKGKNFTELDDETKFKVMVNEMIPVWIDYRIKQDPKLVGMQSRLAEFINKKDKTSAAGMSHQAKIVATNFANEFLSIATGNKARLKQSETASPNKLTTKPHVKAANVGNHSIAAPSESRKIDWRITDADLFGT